jgi:Fe-S-cluster containining protein
MGYPAYVTPRDPMTSAEIDALQQQTGNTFSARRRKEMLAGHPGESHWHNVSDELKAELEAYIASYEKPKYGQTLDTFDGPCIWLDMETRMCKHHTVRPNVCRDFETGSPECLDWRRTYEDKIK